MRQENGTDLLGANDPRGATIGVIYVSANDDRKSVLAAILTQEKLGREQVAVVLPPNQQNKAFQRPVDFDDLKAMRRKLKTRVVFIAPSGPGPAVFARQRGFQVYSSTESYANALRVESQVQGAAKKSWLFGSPGAKPVAPVVPVRSRSTRRTPNEPLPAAPSHGARRDFAEEEDEHERGGSVAPFVGGAALGVGGAMAYEHMHDHEPAHGDDMDYDDGPATPAEYGHPSDPSSHDFDDDADALGPPSTPMPAVMPEDIASSTQAMPLSRSAPDIDDSPVIELRSRRGRPTLPLPQREPDAIPETPVSAPTRPSRTSRQLPPAALVAGGAIAGAAAASVAAPSRNPASGRTVPATGAGMSTVASRPGRFGGLPPRSTPPGRGGRGGGGGGGRRPVNRRGLLLAGLIILLLALLLCGGLVFAQPTNPVSKSVRAVFGLPSSGTVSITPDSKPISDTYTLTGADKTDPAARTVAVRTIAGTAQSAAVQVNATGQAVRAAIQAVGSLTFINDTGSIVTLPAGTTINVGGGVKLVSNGDANVPPLTGTTVGQITVTAHATPAGQAGNVGAFVLNAVGVGNGISVSNTIAFTGGQDPANYKFLQKTDITNAVTQQMLDTTKQDALSNLSKQLHTGEQPFGATQCNPVISSDQLLGDNGAAKQVNTANVTYRMKCTATAYDYAGAQTVASGLLAQKAATTLPAGYAAVSNIQVSLTNQTTANNTTSFFFSSKGLWGYQFTDQQKQNIVRSIAGKSVAEAEAILRNTPGIGKATITIGSGNSLPSDPNQLSIQIQPLTTGSTAVTGAPTAPPLSQPTVAAPLVQGGGGAGAK